MHAIDSPYLLKNLLNTLPCLEKQRPAVKALHLTELLERPQLLYVSATEDREDTNSDTVEATVVIRADIAQFLKVFPVVEVLCNTLNKLSLKYEVKLCRRKIRCSEEER